MDLHDIQEYLYEHIPITQFMGVQVIAYGGNNVQLSAPLSPNLNHRNTAFGGSLSALAILSGWTLLHIKMQEMQRSARLVIQHGEMSFSAPVEDDFYAECAMPAADIWDRFERAFTRRGRSRVQLDANIVSKGKVVARHTGSYVAISQ